MSRDLIVAETAREKQDGPRGRETRVRRRNGRSSGRGRTRRRSSWAEGGRTRGGGAARKSERRIFWEDQSACGEEAAAGPRAACVPEKVQCPLSDARYQSRRRAGIKRERRQSRRPRDSSRTLPAPDAARAERERERDREREREKKKERARLRISSHMRWKREILQRKIKKIYAGAECDEKKRRDR